MRPQNNPSARRGDAWGEAYLAENTKEIAACQFGQLLERPALTHQLRKQVRVSTNVLDAFRCAECVWKRGKTEKEINAFLAHTRSCLMSHVINFNANMLVSCLRTNQKQNKKKPAKAINFLPRLLEACERRDYRIS